MSTTGVSHDIDIFVGTGGRETEIRQFCVIVFIEQKVIQFDIPVRYTFAVTIGQSTQYLCEPYFFPSS